MSDDEHQTLEPYHGGLICRRCGAQGAFLEPLFDLKLAAELVPMRYESLRAYLSKNRAAFPARYRFGTSHRRIRLLSATEIQRIRGQVLHGPGKAL
jgi:hypothetical protein